MCNEPKDVVYYTTPTPPRNNHHCCGYNHPIESTSTFKDPTIHPTPTTVEITPKTHTHKHSCCHAACHTSSGGALERPTITMGLPQQQSQPVMVPSTPQIGLVTSGIAVQNVLNSLTEEAMQRIIATIDRAQHSQPQIERDLGLIETDANELPICHVQNDNRPHIRVKMNKVKAHPLLDSGAMMSVVSYMDEEELTKFNAKLEKGNITITTVSQQNHEITGIMWLDYEMNGQSVVLPTVAMKSHKSYMIVGMDFWEAFDIRCIQGQNSIAVKPWNPEPIAQPTISPTELIQATIIKENPMETGMLSIRKQVAPRFLKKLIASSPKYGCLNYQPNQRTLIAPNHPVSTQYELSNIEAEHSNSTPGDSHNPIGSTTGTSATEVKVNDTRTATEFIRHLLVSMPKREVAVHEIAVQPEIVTASGHDDSYTDVKRPKHTCVTEPHELTPKQKAQLEEVLSEFPYTTESGPLNCTPLYEQSINTGDASPEMRKQYPMSPYIMKEIEEEIKNLIDRDIIEPILMSEWRWPILWVKKKGGGGRICLDARGLNRITMRDAYPTLKVDTILHNLPQAKFITCLDMTQAFHQIGIKKTDRCKTAFAVGHKFYQYKRATMGFTNSPADLAKVLDQVFGDLIPSVYHYVDDFIVLSATFERHIELLGEVARRLREAQLTISKKKSLFCHKKITFLGYVLTENGLQPNPERLTPIMDYKRPTNVRELRRLVGLIGWYRRFIPNAAEILAPMSDMMKGDSKKRIEWTTEAEQAFEHVKKALTEAPILTSPDYDLPYKIYTDASLIAGAAVLTQMQKGEERVIAYHSAKFTKTQSNYSATERECLAVLMGVEKFRPFIDGVGFTVVTDHASLKWLQNLKEPHGKLARWAVRLQAFQITFEHRPGKLMIVPDALSRSMDMIQIEQETKTSDNWYNQMYSIAKAGKLHRYRIEEGLLYHLGPWDIQTGKRKWTLCVPKEKISEVMSEQHDQAHFGFWKTLKSTQRLYYWPNMHQTISDYVKACTECKLIKPSNENTRVPTGEYFDPKTVGRVLSIDLIGPLPASKYHKHIWIIMVVDVFSKYVFAKACTRATANVITEFLEKDIFYRFETPEIIISDNVTQFTSNLFEKFLDEHKIRHILVPVYHPQSNPVEATNKNVKTLLRLEMLRRADHTDWSSYLAKSIMRLNTVPRMPTGQTPHCIVYGREKAQSGEEHRLIGDVNHTDVSPEEVTENRGVIYENVAEQQRVAFEKNKQHYDLRARIRKFKPGDQVYIKNQIQSSAGDQITKKLAQVKKLAYIQQKVENATDMYRLSDSQGKEIGIYHANQLYSR